MVGGARVRKVKILVFAMEDSPSSEEINTYATDKREFRC